MTNLVCPGGNQLSQTDPNSVILYWKRESSAIGVQCAVFALIMTSSLLHKGADSRSQHPAARFSHHFSEP